MLKQFKLTGQYPKVVKDESDKLPIHSIVRIMVNKGKLDKKTSSNWSLEKYEIISSKQLSSINGARRYKVKNVETNEVMKQSYLKEQLQIIPN